MTGLPLTCKILHLVQYDRKSFKQQLTVCTQAPLSLFPIT